MIEQTEPHDKHNKKKPANWPIYLICIFLLYTLFMIADAADVFVIRMFLKPDIIGHRFSPQLAGLRGVIIEAILYGERHGVQVAQNNRRIASITDKEKFVSGLLEAIFRCRVTNMRRYFDAGIFKILVQDNVCFIRVDINKFSNYISRNPLVLRNSIARYVAYRSERYWLTLNFDRFRPGGWWGPVAFLGNSDIYTPIVFTEEMNEFYVLVFTFINDPPISISAFP